MLAGLAERGSGGPRALINSLPCVRGGGPRSGGRVVKNNPSVGLRRQLPLHKGFASMRSMLAGVAETGSETALAVEGV